jgi:hypothetical protein
MRCTPHILSTTLAAVAALALPAGAAAAIPWSDPAPIPNATGAPAQSAFTLAGHGVVLSPQVSGPGLAPAQLTAVAADGSVTSRQPLAFVETHLATYANDRIIVAGRTLATSGPNVGTIDDTSLIVTRTGTPAAIGATRVVPGSKGRQLYALASNHAGKAAMVIGSLRTRTVLVGTPSRTAFVAKLRIKVSNRARGATVAIGDAGDVLVVYEDNHEILARHIGSRGTVGKVHRLGAGVQSNLQALVADDGRLLVAWKSQRVSEGEAGTPAIVSFATAAPGHNFGSARKVATVGATGAGHYVAPPGVRLVAAGDGALLAYTGFDGTNYTVEARQVTGGHLATAQRLTPAGFDAVLGDADADAKGQVVTWRANIAGADPNVLPGGQQAPTPVFANVRGASAAQFGGAEAISPADAGVPYNPSAAIDPVSGRSIVAYGTLTPAAVLIASRPAP